MANSAPGLRPRPLSPFMIWRWHVTMLTSILHRAAGVGLYLGALILAGWAVALASGPEAYAGYTDILGSIPGKLLMFLITAAAFFHMANGVRHLVWDMGHGFEPRTATLTAWISIGFGFVAALALWLARGLFFGGA